MRNFLLLLSIIIVSFSSCVDNESEQKDLLAAVPKSSVLLVQTQDLSKLKTEIVESEIYNDIDSIPLILELRNEFQDLAKLFQTDTLDQFLKNRQALFSLALSGAEKYKLLFITTKGSFSKVLKAKLASKFKNRQRDYSGTTIIVYSQDDKEKYSFCEHKGLIVFSTSRALVEESVRQINGDFNLKNDPEFQKLLSTANPKDLANVFLKNADLPNYINTLLPKAKVSILSKLGSWTELDFQIYHKELLLSGITLAGEEFSLLSNFIDVAPQRTEAENIIPKNTGLWFSYTFDNSEHYYRNYIKALKSKGRFAKYNQLLSSTNVKDPASKILEWVDTELGLIYTGVNGDSHNKIAYFKTRSKEKALESLSSISDSNYIEGYRGYIIKQLDPINILPRFYGSVFDGFKRPFYFATEDFIWIAESESVLKGFINDIVINKPLSEDESFKSFQTKTPSKSHIKVVYSNPGLLDLLPPFLDRKENRELEKSKPQLNNLKWASLQFEIKKDLAYTNFLMVNEPKVEDEVSREWNTVLEAPAAIAPQFVLNHNNKKYEILLQDKNHLLYLLDRHGKILWKKQLDGKLLGASRQVDLYKNNKLQLVFNTVHSLYIIDRLGRDLDNFPVKLPSSATAAVGVFNYDRARNYRFLVPIGGKILNYGKDGNLVRGWQFPGADGNIISRPQLFTVNKKDLIVALTENGTLYIVDRRGLNRFAPILGLEDVVAPFFLRESDNLKNTELIARNKSGEMAVINFNGSTDAIYLDDQSPAEHFLYFQDKYIFSSGNKLIVKDIDLPWTAELEEDISSLPKVMLFEKEFYVAVWSADAQEIRLFNKKGELVKGFPVFAQAQFDMGSLKQNGVINIVTTTLDGTVICYEIN